ncbi:MAG: ABC transporter ATP-binding protein [Thaumarchaeota archaeon]|nr:ABC transporter ATP-binding protein [Nitrososphaerota archaeon]
MFVEVNDVKKSFQMSRQKETLQVLDGISFSADQGEVVSIIGPSGCGKTTLVRILAGIEKQDSGSIKIENHEVTGPGSNRGMVFQTFNLFPWMTIEQNVGIGILDLPEEERKKRVETYLAMVNLQGFEKYHPHQLSGGMQQRVGVARAMALEPKVLLVDEALANVDAQTAEQLMDQLLQVFAKTKKTVIYVTHNMDEAIYMSNRIVVLSKRPSKVIQVLDDELPTPRWEKDTRAMPEYGQLRTTLRKSLGLAR